jgi:hypothetical protein
MTDQDSSNQGGSELVRIGVGLLQGSARARPYSGGSDTRSAARASIKRVSRPILAATHWRNEILLVVVGVPGVLVGVPVDRDTSGLTVEFR